MPSAPDHAPDTTEDIIDIIIDIISCLLADGSCPHCSNMAGHLDLYSGVCLCDMLSL